jgi:hypothetical protein
MGKDSKMNNFLNKIMIGIGLNTAEATKQISELQNKLKNISGRDSSSPTSQLAQQYRAGGNEQRAKQLEEFGQRQNTQNRRVLQQDLQRQEKLTGDLLDKEKRINAILETKAKQGRDIVKSKEIEAKISDQLVASSAKELEIREKLDRLKEPGTGGKIGGKIAGFSAGIGSIGTILTVASKAADVLNRQIPTYRAERSASLAEKTYESSYQAMRGDSFRNLMFAQERQAALKDTGAFGQNQRGINQGLGMGLGLTGTALIGAGLATLLTGGLALAPLAVGGAIAAGGVTALSAKGGMGFESITGNFDEIDKMTGVQMMDYFKKRTAAEEAKDKHGSLIKDFLTENRAELIQGLRQSGMQEQDFMKNYVQGSALLGGKDFDFLDKFRASQQILGAGGGSEAAFGQNAILALQAQRGMGVSNAGQLIGGLSSYQGAKGGAQAFEEAMARGVSIGLDKSKYREENRAYLTKVTEMARQVSGGESVISASILAGMGDNITQRGVEIAAEQAKGLFDTLSQSGGIVGAMKMRGIAQSDTFKNIKGIDRVLLSRMRFEDIKADNEEIEYFYEKDRKEREKSGDFGPRVSIEQFSKELRDLYRKSEVGAYGHTEEGKKLLEIYDKIEKEEATPEEIKEGTALYSFFADQKGPYADRKARFFEATGMEKFFSTEKARQQQEEYEALNTRKYGGLLMGDVVGAPLAPDFLGRSLSEKEEARYAELEKRFAGYKGRGASTLEDTKAGEGIMQANIIGGEKMTEVMAGLARSTTERLNMALSEQINLMGFQKALEDKAGDMMAALINNLSGRKMSKPVPDRHQDTVTNNLKTPEQRKQQIKASNMNSTSR